jgi:hypothetical protein
VYGWLRLGKKFLGEPYCVSGDSYCTDLYGYGSTYDSLNKSCKCQYGYVWDDSFAGEKCVSCSTKYGYGATSAIGGGCECSSGYELSLKSIGTGLECKSCMSKYGLHSSFDYLSKKCECDDGYTLKDNECVKKQNNVYFYLKELDTNNKQAIIRSDYDSQNYLIKYGSGCYASSFKSYLRNNIVINLGTDYDLDTWDNIVLYDDDETCSITYVKSVGSSYGLKQNDSDYSSPSTPISCPKNSTQMGTQCYCNTGYVISGDKNICIEQPKTPTPVPAEPPTVQKPEDNTADQKQETAKQKEITCNNGYALSLDKKYCVKIPKNAHTVNSKTDVWLCDEGYNENNNNCSPIKQGADILNKISDSQVASSTASSTVLDNQKNKGDDAIRNVGPKIKLFFVNTFAKIKGWFKNK